MRTTELLEEADGLTRQLDRLARRWSCPDPECDGLPHPGWLHHHARASQQEPDDYNLWAMITGRGFGKTRTGAETVKDWAVDHGGYRYAVIAKNDRECRKICFEGPAGLLNVIDPDLYDQREGYKKGAGDTSLTLYDGTVYMAFSAESPDNVRGYAFAGAWFDEYAAWPINTAQEMTDNIWFCLREAPVPRIVITTTPKPVPHVVKLIEDAKHRPGTVITTGSMLENSPNLSPIAMAKLVDDYGGTRLGRQELEGELLTDVPGALWQGHMIQQHRVDADGFDHLELAAIYVVVDPAITNHQGSDETGIIVAGVTKDRHFYVLHDGTVKATPDAWTRRVVDLYHDWSADRVVVEANQGGDAWRDMIGNIDDAVPTRKVHASISKRLRAEPISALYEQGRVHHVGMFPALEDQMTTWVPLESPGSPDRIDALVWAIAELERSVKHSAPVVPFGETRSSPWKID